MKFIYVLDNLLCKWGEAKNEYVKNTYYILYNITKDTYYITLLETTIKMMSPTPSRAFG